MKIYNPFKHLKLDKEEREINTAIESGKLKMLPVNPKEKRLLRQYVKQTLDKTRNINIRISEADLQRLKTKAMEEGIPYQTLAGSIIHKYTSSSSQS